MPPKSRAAKAAVVADPAPVAEPTVGKTLFSAHFLDGYVIRRLIEYKKVCCSSGTLMLGEAHIRPQSRNHSNPSAASVFHDILLFAHKIGNYQFSPATPDIDLLVVHYLLGEMGQSLADVRKKMPATISHLDGETQMRVTQRQGSRDPDYVSIQNTDDEPSDPPDVPVPEHQPNLTLSVATFCAVCAKFIQRKSKFVKVTMFPHRMHWAGYIDETRTVKEYTFENEGASVDPNEGPGEMFVFPRKFVAMLGKIAQVPAEKSKATIRIYHAPGSPIKVSFDVGSIGVCNTYLRDTLARS